MDFSFFAPVLPELILAIGAMAILMLEAFTKDGTIAGRESGWLAIGILLAAGVALVTATPSGTFFEGAFLTDQMTTFLKVLILVAAGLTLLITFDSFRRAGTMLFEYPVLVLLATLGMMMMVSANDLLALYLGLELQSLALYVIAAFKRDDVKSSEAGLKYFVLGALSSGMLLYGVSMLYGITGSTGYGAIATALKAEGTTTNIGLIVGLVFVLVGLAFKISAVPFHMWTPDVYQGAPTPVTAFFAGAPKVAAMALLIRFTQGAMADAATQWQQIIIFLAIASMLLGAFAAIGQTNIKRLMAYSSIGHVGFALVGLAANSTAGTAGVLIYLAIYVAMTLGTFACILSMRRGGENVEDISELAGLAKTDLRLAVILGILMFSLAGIPWLAGFWAKWYVLLPAIEAKLYVLAVIGVIASVIGAFYYLRIVKIMFFDESAEPFAPTESKTLLVMCLSVIFASFYVAPFIGDELWDAATAAASQIAVAH